MRKFEVGMQVKCINAKPLQNALNAPPLNLNKEYIIGGIKICAGCGGIALDVGIALSEGCICDCGVLVRGTNIWWCDAIRFVIPMEDSEENKSKEQLEKELEKAIDSEDFELASKIRDKLKNMEEVL